MGKKKLPGEDLEPKLKETLENMKDDELRKKVSEVALYRSSRSAQMKADPDLKQKREALNFAAADFKEDIKGADNEIGYISYLLEARGKA